MPCHQFRNVLGIHILSTEIQHPHIPLKGDHFIGIDLDYLFRRPVKGDSITFIIGGITS